MKWEATNQPGLNELSIVGLHLVPEGLEGARDELEGFDEVGDHGGAISMMVVVGALALGGVGSDQPLELLVDLLCQLEKLIEIGIQPATGVSHGGAILSFFHLLVAFLQAAVERLHFHQILLHILHFAGERLHPIYRRLRRLHVDLERTVRRRRLTHD